MLLTKKQVYAIPTLRLTMTVCQIAILYNVHYKTIARWIKVMRADGIHIPVPSRRMDFGELINQIPSNAKK